MCNTEINNDEQFVNTKMEEKEWEKNDWTDGEMKSGKDFGWKIGETLA